MQNNKNKLKKVLTASILVGIMTGSNTNAGFIRTLGELGGGAFALTTIYKIGKNIFEKLKSTPIEECKISDIEFNNIYVFNGKMMAATSSDNLCFLHNLMNTRNTLVSASKNGFNDYYGSEEQLSEAVEEVNQAYLNGQVKDVFRVNYFDLGNGSKGSIVRVINYYMDTKNPESRIKIQITPDTLFRFEDKNFSFKIKNADIIQQLNKNMIGVIDASVSASTLGNFNIQSGDIEIIEKPMEKSYNLIGQVISKNENDARLNNLKKVTIDNLSNYTLEFCKIPNEELILIHLNQNKFTPNLSTPGNSYGKPVDNINDTQENYPDINEISNTKNKK